MGLERIGKYRMSKPVKFVKKAVKFVKRRGARGVMEKMHIANPKNELLKHMEFIMDRKEYPFDEKQIVAEELKAMLGNGKESKPGCNN